MHPDYFLLPVALILLIVTAISMEKRGDKEEGEKKNSKKEKKTSTTNSWMHTFGCWTAIIVAIWLLAWWGFHYVYNNNYISTWLPPNEFGDMFGALTCLFSGIAIAGVIAMLRQQHEEMKETRDEFAAQTKQFEAQTKQFKAQLALARSSQIKDEIYRRIDYVKKLEANCCLITEEKVQSNSSITHSVSRKGLEAIDIIVNNIGKIDNLNDEQVETFAIYNTFTNGSINAWLKSCIHLSNFIYHESKLDEEEKLYYLIFSSLLFPPLPQT